LSSSSFSWSSGFSSCPGFPAHLALHDRRAPRSGRTGTTLLTKITAGEHLRCQFSNTLARSAKRPLRSWCSAETSQLPFAPSAAQRRPNSNSQPLRPPDRRSGPGVVRARLRAAVDACEEERSALYSCFNRHSILVPRFRVCKFAGFAVAVIFCRRDALCKDNLNNSGTSRDSLVYSGQVRNILNGNSGSG
jgi:hypothetical protein